MFLKKIVHLEARLTLLNLEKELWEVKIEKSVKIKV